MTDKSLTQDEVTKGLAGILTDLLAYSIAGHYYGLKGILVLWALGRIIRSGKI